MLELQPVHNSKEKFHILKIWEIFFDLSQFKLGNIRSYDVFRPIVHERKSLVDYNCIYLLYLQVITHALIGQFSRPHSPALTTKI